jgi:hypothetical protein
MKQAYFGYCNECEEWGTLAWEDFGVAPDHHDWQVVCPKDYEHTVDHIEVLGREDVND